MIVHGDGSVTQQCVSFAEESISGYDLLQRAGPPLSVEAGGFGTTVCSIDGEGCSYPAEACFCQCQGSPCVYWSYWRLQAEGGWRYQPLGAGTTQVQDGDVEAWRWAAGTRADAPEPPPATFAAICTPGAQTSSSAQPAVSSPAATPSSPQTRAQGEPASTGTANVGTPESQEGVRTEGWLWLLAGVVLVPAAVLLIWALLRRGPVKR